MGASAPTPCESSCPRQSSFWPIRINRLRCERGIEKIADGPDAIRDAERHAARTPHPRTAAPRRRGGEQRPPSLWPRSPLRADRDQPRRPVHRMQSLRAAQSADSGKLRARPHRQQEARQDDEISVSAARLRLHRGAPLQRSHVGRSRDVRRGRSDAKWESAIDLAPVFSWLLPFCYRSPFFRAARIVSSIAAAASVCIDGMTCE